MGDSSKLWQVKNSMGEVLGELRAMNESLAKKRAEKTWPRAGRLKVLLATKKDSLEG